MNIADDPIVSVIIPCYNTGNFLSFALESAIGQGFKDIEIIVIDDGSTDDTPVVTEKYLADGRVRYVRQENKGLSAARNRGIEISRGRYIALLDADDVWAEEKLALQVEMLVRDHTISMVFTDFSTFDSDGCIAYSKTPSHLFAEEVTFQQLFSRHNFIYPSTVLMRKAVLETAGLFDTNLKSAEDYDMWLRLAGTGRIVGIPRPLVDIRQHDSNMSLNVRRMLEADLAVLVKYRGSFAEKFFRRRVAKCYFMAADRLICQSRRFESLRCALRGFINWPFCLVDMTVIMIKHLLGVKVLLRARRQINTPGSVIGRIYWYLYSRY